MKKQKSATLAKKSSNKKKTLMIKITIKLKHIVIYIEETSITSDAKKMKAIKYIKFSLRLQISLLAKRFLVKLYFRNYAIFT